MSSRCCSYTHWHETCRPSGFDANMCSSPTPSVTTSTRSELTIILDRWELSASLEENHADGGIHLHAFAMWERQFETRNVRLFDVDGCHPNIAVIKRTPEAAFDYAIKDGDVVAGGLQRPSRDSVASPSGKWTDIIAAGTREEFLNSSRTWILAHFASVSPVWPSTPTGNIDQSLPTMRHLEEYRLTRNDLHNSMTGLQAIWEETL